MKLLLRFSRALCAVCCAAPLTNAVAQEPRRLATLDSIPVELATALVASGGFGGEPIILVGALPEWFTSRVVVPAEGRVLGAASLGSTVVGIYNVRSAPDVAIAELKTSLLAHGWKNPPPPFQYPGGGFRPATMLSQFNPTGPSTRATLCRDDAYLIASAAAARGGATNVTLRLAASGGPMSYTTCNPPARPEMPAGRPLYPTLYDPPISGDQAGPNACLPNYNGMASTSNYLRSTLSPEQVLEHYARQLQDSGWAPAAPALSSVGRTFTRRDSTGAPIDLTLTVAASPKGPSCRDVSMQVRTPPKP